MVRLAKSLASHVRMFSSDEHQIEAVVREALSRCIVITCINEAQFLESLRSMPQKISSDHNIHAIIVDHIAAFYWISRVQTDISMEQQIHIAQAVRALVKDLRIAVYVAKPALFSGTIYREYLPHAWQSLAAARLLCSRLDNNIFQVAYHSAHSATSGAGLWKYMMQHDRLCLLGEQLQQQQQSTISGSQQ